MYETIIAICKQLIGEANAIIGYTEDIAKLSISPANDKATELLDEIRIDEVEHVQKLAIQLTECFYTKEPAPEDENEKTEKPEEGEGE